MPTPLTCCSQKAVLVLVEERKATPDEEMKPGARQV